MIDKETTIERLQKLVDHLRNGKLGVDTFDFHVVRQIVSCGTAGCAMGELPILFPDNFRFTEADEDSPYLNVIDTEGRFNGWAAREYLGIGEITSDFMFYPDSRADGVQYEGLINLHGDATKEEVANNIESHINWLKENE